MRRERKDRSREGQQCEADEGRRQFQGRTNLLKEREGKRAAGKGDITKKGGEEIGKGHKKGKGRRENCEREKKQEIGEKKIGKGMRIVVDYVKESNMVLLKRKGCKERQYFQVKEEWSKEKDRI